MGTVTARLEHARGGEGGHGSAAKRRHPVLSVSRGQSLPCRNAFKPLPDHQPPVFIPERTIRMLRQAESAAKCLDSFLIFLLLIEEIAIKIPGVQSGRRKVDSLLQQLPRLCLVAEANWKARDPIVEHAKAGRRSSLELRGCHSVGLLENVTGTFGKTERRERTCHRGPLAGDNAVPNQHFRSVREFRSYGVRIFAERVHLLGLVVPFGNAELDRLPC